MYCKIERSYGLYNSIFRIEPEMNRLIEEKAIATQNDEYLYYHELLKLWAIDADNKEPPEFLITKMKNEKINRDFSSDLYATLMGGYIEKGLMDKANESGAESLRLNSENWKLWTYWFTYFKKQYYSSINTDRNLTYLKEMIKSYTKAIKYRQFNTVMLFGEIV